MNTLTKAAQDVLAERARQVSAEGWTPEHDDQHGDGAMSVAAACYALADSRAEAQHRFVGLLWPWTGWASMWWKPKDRRRNLVRATALMSCSRSTFFARVKAGIYPKPGPDGQWGVRALLALHPMHQRKTQ